MSILLFMEAKFMKSFTFGPEATEVVTDVT